MHNVPSPPPFLNSTPSPPPKSLPPDRLFFDQIGMQDIHSLLNGGDAAAATGGVRIFGDRRMRAAPHGHHHHHHHHHQALKCPRCDSLNTKFCYYNNYNLSQPRHFCKNCRRYWTKGGVLRNVPVGGGCRKSKRSSKRAKKASPNSPPPPHKSSHSDSSSESTSANANANAVVASSSPILPPMPMSASFAGEIGSFVSLLDGEQPQQHQNLIGYAETTPFGMQQQNQVNNNDTNNNPWGQGMVFDQAGHVDPGDGVPAGGDWQGVSGGGGGHLGMFDLTPGSDWCQSSQWHESDHHLYLPP